MNELKYKFHCITPTTLHISTEITTSQFYTSTAEGFDAQITNLVEVFLVEIYRCKLCQFTTSLRNKISLHVSDVHQPDQIHFISGSLDIEPSQEENDSYGVGEDIAQENKENEENLEKMPFLLPMYRILNTMSPDSCDMSLGDHSSNTNMANTSVVNSLFEEESSQFHLDESVPGDSTATSDTANSPTSKRSKDEEDAQCEHLLSLGLCRISSVRTLSSEADKTKTDMKEDSSKPHNKRTRSVCLSKDKRKGDNYKQKYVCTACRIELNTKERYRIHMQCHNGGEGFNCLYCGCYMTKWSFMEKHIHIHKPGRKSYQCQACQKCFITQRAWKAHKRSHDGESHSFFCTKCPASFETEHLRNLHLSCHHEDVFKCWECGLVDQEWSKIYEHLCIHDHSLKSYMCSTCNQIFFREAQLKAHAAKHKNHRSVVCSQCDQMFKTSCQMSRHHNRFHHKPNISEGRKRKKNKSDAHTCIAGPEDSIQSEKHTNRQFSCDICSRKCSSKLTLQRHMGVHAEEKPFQCHECEYKTRLKASLIQHMRIHTGEKPFKCEQCSYASIDASSLRRHVRTHTNEKPYKCQHCSYSSIQKKCLDLHVRRHHTGEMFSCSFCEYSSPDKQLLQKHAKKYHTKEDSELSNAREPCT
ncbi:uncharacterized protein O3C94_007716 isoform 1-T1 [Discoglossus pictus]